MEESSHKILFSADSPRHSPKLDGTESAKDSPPETSESLKDIKSPKPLSMGKYVKADVFLEETGLMPKSVHFVKVNTQDSEDCTLRKSRFKFVFDEAT